MLYELTSIDNTSDSTQGVCSTLRPFTAPVAAVPEAFKAIGTGAAFGDKAGVDNEGLLMLGRNHLGNRCFAALSVMVP
jgi:hypothetical protein